MSTAQRSDGCELALARISDAGWRDGEAFMHLEGAGWVTGTPLTDQEAAHLLQAGNVEDLTQLRERAIECEFRGGKLTAWWLLRRA